MQNLIAPLRRHRFLRTALAAGLLTVIAGCGDGQASSEPDLLRIPYSDSEQRERDFFVYLPRDYHSDTQREWPVLMFLHGNGERGNGKDELDFVMMHGPLMEAWVFKRDLPFIIIAPQLPMFSFRQNGPAYLLERQRENIPRRKDQGTPPRAPATVPEEPMDGVPAADMTGESSVLPEGWDKIEQDLIRMLDLVETRYRTDRARTYLSGLSYGGFGTWYLASKYPRRFAAIAPIAGWGHPDLVTPLADARTPVWAFAGGLDPVIPVEQFYPGLNQLKALGHPQVRFTVHEDMGHDVWRRVYAGEDFYQWLLSHELPGLNAETSEH
ncbi:alpha/beta hydrolase-fold protein [Microbulbifer sp. Q7]|uniref:carboxylesterase family protein n=1 Tax=Microbulbifer sp. Q7 TaxID=1785091 RepID=UPI000829BA3E|nr:alpha/beta hydrolase-fold protein [Microbulbifer sp. Q7]